MIKLSKILPLIGMLFSALLARCAVVSAEIQASLKTTNEVEALNESADPIAEADTKKLAFYVLHTPYEERRHADDGGAE